MEWILVPAAYLAGSISFSVLLVRLLQDRDVRRLGSGNAGATNVLRVAGKAPAVLVLLLDVAKGALPVMIGERLGVSRGVLAATAVAAVVGHMAPIFHRFRGGKGVATAAGALGALNPGSLAVSLLAFLLTLAATRYVSLASMVAVGLYPLVVAAGVGSGRIEDGGWQLVAASTVVALLVIWRHRENIRRLWMHQESRLGGRVGLQ